MHRLPLPSAVPAIFVAGLNYTTHADEVKLPIPRFPVFAMKSPNALLYPSDAPAPTPGFGIQRGDTIVVPRHLQQPDDADYEGEMAIVIGKECRNVPATADAVNDVVLGYTAALDITSRRWQGKKGGNQWCFAKSFDTFCPLGPDVVAMPVEDACSLQIATRLNGETVQQDTTANMVFNVVQLVAFLSQGTTLLPGSVILTGTPAGVGFTRTPPRYLRAGDAIEVSLGDILTRRCEVRYE